MSSTAEENEEVLELLHHIRQVFANEYGSVRDIKLEVLLNSGALHKCGMTQVLKK